VSVAHKIRRCDGPAATALIIPTQKTKSINFFRYGGPCADQVWTQGKCPAKVKIIITRGAVAAVVDDAKNSGSLLEPLLL
jgi:hypothetical protein